MQVSNRNLFAHIFLPLLALSTLALASPYHQRALDVDDHFDVDLFHARATGTKYVGSKCTANSECFSALCAATNGTTTKTCQRQPAGGPCSQDSNCLSRSCSRYTNGTCDNVSKVLGVCSISSDCYEVNELFECQAGICKYRRGSPCTKDSQCEQYNKCINQTCTLTASLPPNAKCENDGDCISNSCDPKVDYSCFDDQGAYTTCDYGPVFSFCAQYPLGHTCKNSGDCANAICKGGKCQVGQDGDPCVEPNQCANLCGSDNKCFTPSNRTLPPNFPCKQDVQCQTGRCTTEQLEQNADGVNFNKAIESRPLRCDYFNLGEGTCHTFRDCIDGLCIKGKCALAPDGARCQETYQCQNWCSKAGYCYTPTQTTNLTRKSPCKTDANCKSHACAHIYPAFTRPSLDNSSVSIGVYEGLCS